MAAGSTYTPIATQTLGTAALNVTFSSIPSTYTDLVVVCAYNRVSGGNNISMRLNGDTTNYSETYIEGDGSSVISGRNANDSNMRIAFIVGGTGTSQSTMIINLQNYSNTTTYKTVLTRYSEASTGVGASVGLWRSTAAINSVEIGRAGINFAAGSTFTLYGIAAA
jgi:hypothetical protein